MKANEAVALGRRMLNRQLELLNKRYADLEHEQIDHVLAEYKMKSEEDLLRDIGLGNRLAPLIARKLTLNGEDILVKEEDSRDSSTPLQIKGTEGMVVSFPKCCYPIPGDPIIGFASAGRGIVIHTQTCKNIAEYRNHPEKWINVKWEDHIDRIFPTLLRMNAINQRGVLATVASAISDQEANIINVDIKDKGDRYTKLEFVVEVRNRKHLADVMRRLRGIRNVSNISRR